MAIRNPPSKAVDPFNDDPFQHTTMTFGEHLRELRGALFKALLSLVVGFCLGLALAKTVVHHIQTPLVAALERYYLGQSVERFEQHLTMQAEAGDTNAKEILARGDDALEDWVQSNGMLFDEYYVVPDELFGELKKRYPKLLDKVELPEHKDELEVAKKDMLRLQLWHPIKEDSRTSPTALSSDEVFVIWLKAAFLTGAIISSPASFYFLWAFVAAGLYPHEKKYVHLFLPFSLALFFLGAAMAYFFVFPPMLKFFFSFNSWLGINPEPRIGEWLSFVLLLPLGFGISFQLPLLMLFMERIGIFSVTDYVSKWRIAVLVIAVASMVLTPGGDPNAMLLMFFPLVGLFFLGIGLCKWMPKRSSPAAA